MPTSQYDFLKKFHPWISFLNQKWEIEAFLSILLINFLFFQIQL